MDANTALFQLKKVEKSFSVGKPCSEKTEQTLVEICRYLTSMKMTESARRIHEVLLAIRSKGCFLKSLASRISGVMVDLKKIKEKQMEMRFREAEARNHFFKKNKKKANTEISNVSKYDVIFAPTQGGYHYCVVAEVNPRNYVRCYPMTTGTEETLRMVNADYVKVGSDGGKDIYLTSSCATLPYYTAINCFVKKAENKDIYKKAIANFHKKADYIY